MSRSVFKYILPIIFLCFVLAGTLFIVNDYSISFFMPFAPVIYIICICLVYIKRPSAFDSIAVLIIFALNFLRMVFVPVIYVLSGYVSTIETAAGTEYLNEAVALVGLEMFCTTLLILSSKKLSKISSYTMNTELNSKIKIKLHVKAILFCLVLLGIICVLSDKSVLAIVSTIFDRLSATAEMNAERRRAYLSAKENSSLIFNLFYQVVFYLQILIPASLISYAINKRNELNSNKGFVLGLIISALSVLFITDNNIDSVCIMLACLLVLFSVYSEKVSRILPFLLIAVASFIAMFLFSKVGLQLGGEIKIDDLSRVLCAYFSAFPNVSCGFAVQYDHKLATFWGDIVSGVPYMMVFFRGYPKSVTLFNIAAHGNTGLTNQIMPLISYGYQYLWVFAPIFTLLVYNIAFNLEVKFINTNKTFNRVLYALMFINLSVGPCIFGFSSTIKRLCYYVPLFILANLNGDSDRIVE